MKTINNSQDDPIRRRVSAKEATRIPDAKERGPPARFYEKQNTALRG
jgi:hypothetical protein